MTEYDRTLRRLTRDIVEAERYADMLPNGSADHAAWLAKVVKLRAQLRHIVSTAEPLHPDALHIIRHALGVDPDKRGSRGYRNMYVVRDRLWLLDDLEQAGLVVIVPSNILEGRVYRVTEAGAKAAGCSGAWTRWKQDQ
jgi:hypothetical protein